MPDAPQQQAFTIASLALAGGGRIGICRLPGREGDLAGDMAVIRAWKPALVLSMTETAEMQEFGAATLAAELARASIAWRHFPIVDYGGPDATRQAQWPQLSLELHRRLETGEGILLHCRGGQGRSGMVALKLLVERGEQPDQALARIRAVRPGAVETDGQRQWGAYTPKSS